MFPELVLERKVNLFSLSHCVCSFLEEKLSRSTALENETEGEKKRKEKKNTIRRWNISKRLQTTEGNQALPLPRTGHDGKRLLNDTGSLQKIQFEHFSCPSVFSPPLIHQ